MNVLVTGCNGQLGSEMQVMALHFPQHQFFFTDKFLVGGGSLPIFELDICDEHSVQSFVQQNSIDTIVNCAAYTDVDKAEQDIDTATLLNSSAVANLAKTKCNIIHISTDYVFDGKHYLPYTETDCPAPSTIYGKTKWEGEQQLFQLAPTAIVIRTSWLYSSFGKNFVKTMLRIGAEKESISVVFDQIGTPTYAFDLAQCICTILNSSWKSGIYHFSNEGICSWYDFAVQIFKLKNISCNVVPILSSEYGYRTPRPHYSVLDKSKIKSTWGVTISHWSEALRRCLQLL